MTPAQPTTCLPGQTVTVSDRRNPQATCTGTVQVVSERGMLTVLLAKSRLRDAAAGDLCLFHPADWRIVPA